MMNENIYTESKPLRCFFAFEGYNSQGLALNRLKQYYPDFSWVCVGRSEIDKYAIQAANVLFPEYADRNYGDISQIEWDEVPDFDLFTMSSPCQDFSVAGLQKGGEEGSGTRSSLLWECRRAILAKKPRYILMENVKALVSYKFKPLFMKWQDELASYGYTNFIRVLNAADYGVPQHRERVFMVSILDDGASYHFPEPFPLERRLKDILEEDVDERYYLSGKCVKGFVEHNRRHQEKGTGFLCRPKTGEDVACAVRANGAVCPTDNMVAEPVIAALRGRNPPESLGQDGRQPSLEHRAYDCGGNSTAVTTGFMPKIAAPAVLTMPGSRPCDNYIKEPIACAMRGREVYGSKHVNSLIESGKIPADEVAFLDGYNQTAHTDVTATIKTNIDKGNLMFVSIPQCLTPKRNEYGKSVRKKYEAGEIDESRHNMTDLVPRKDGICNTITSVEKDNMLIMPFNADREEMKILSDTADFRIRKLTEREVFRLMDVSEEDIDRIQAAGISRSQQYKMAGNSIVVACLYHIFRKLFVEQESESQQLTIF